MGALHHENPHALLSFPPLLNGIPLLSPQLKRLVLPNKRWRLVRLHTGVGTRSRLRKFPDVETEEVSTLQTDSARVEIPIFFSTFS